MTDDIAIMVGPHRVIRCELHVPGIGPWYADLDFDDTAALSGRVTITSGSTSLVGTVSPAYSGAFLGASRVRVVAGGAGWGQDLVQKAYHNDAGVKSVTVARDAALAAGEVLGSFLPATAYMGVDYCRARTGSGVTCPASRVLADAAHGTPWRVGYDGVTVVEHVSETDIDPRIARVIDPVDVRARLLTLGIDDLSGVRLGMRIQDDRLDSVYVVREYRVLAYGSSITAQCWCAPSEGAARLPRLLGAIARAATDDHIWGRWRYRVVSQASDGRLSLQAVNKTSRLPDQILVPQMMGAPGVTADLKAGATVLVEFLEGDASLPCVTGYSPQSDQQFVPTEIILGGTAGSGVARIGDTVHLLLPPAVCTVVVGGVPSPGVVIFPTSFTLGTIETGSTIVKAST